MFGNPLLNNVLTFAHVCPDTAPERITLNTQHEDWNIGSQELSLNLNRSMGPVGHSFTRSQLQAKGWA